MMNDFSSYRIIDLLDSGASFFVNGEIKNFSSTYKSASGTMPAQKNDDVESFLKKKAESFSRQNLSMTHLVLSSVNQELLGYFSLTIKPISIPAKFVDMSNSTKRKWAKFASYDRDRNVYVASSYLIAQLGKKYSKVVQHPISGDALLDICMAKVKECQDIVGGGIVFLECEKDARLMDFYQKNGFVEYNVRNNLVQMVQRI
jgi:hypothetical protein